MAAITVVVVVSPCSSYHLYSVVTCVWYSPLLNTAVQCNLTVMILSTVVTPKRSWTQSSTCTKVCEDRTEGYWMMKKYAKAIIA